MQVLDLHGTKHDKVGEKVRSFLNFATLPCEIIVGNSSKMKKIVGNIIKEYNWHCEERDSYNWGALIVMEEGL